MSKPKAIVRWSATAYVGDVYIQIEGDKRIADFVASSAASGSAWAKAEGPSVKIVHPPTGTRYGGPALRERIRDETARVRDAAKATLRGLGYSCR